MSAGYSKRPLVDKLGIKAGMRIAVLNPPESYTSLDQVELVERLVKPLDFIHLFTTSRDDLETRYPKLKKALAPAGILWISWPKQAAKKLANIETDLNENIVREIGLANGLVDVKVAAIDEIWSGLKFVYRLEDR